MNQTQETFPLNKHIHLQAQDGVLLPKEVVTGSIKLLLVADSGRSYLRNSLFHISPHIIRYLEFSLIFQERCG